MNHISKIAQPSFAAISWSLLLITIVTIFIFAVFPSIDIYFASLFFYLDKGFIFNDSQSLHIIRKLYELFYFSLIIGASILLLLNFRLNYGMHISARIWGFIVTSFILGPGIFVNMVLKTHWGRARPSKVTEFLGNDQFTPFYLITDQCDKNCSFTSGEGAAIFTAAILIIVLLWDLFHRHKYKLIISVGGLAMFGAGLRIIKGRHFLSDTMFSFLFCAIIILGLYKVFSIGKYRSTITSVSIKEDRLIVISTVFSDIKRVLSYFTKFFIK